MGLPTHPEPVMLIAGLLAQSEKQMKCLFDFLNGHWNDIIETSEVYPFSYSKYYQDELGDEPVRQYVAWKYFFDPDTILQIKLETNGLEKNFSKSHYRCCNIDPGYLGLYQMVLASTKPASYRIYLGQGIYAQSTYYYKGKTFRLWPWTYRDYCQQETIDFFNRVRKYYKKHFQLTGEDALS